MSVSVKIQPTTKLVITRFSGKVTDRDVQRQVELIAASGPYDSSYRAITDFTHVEDFDVTSSMMRSVAAQPSPLAEATRVMVAPKDVEFGMSRMFQTLSHRTRPNITVVRTMAEAYKILSISPDDTV